MGMLGRSHSFELSKAGTMGTGAWLPELTSWMAHKTLGCPMPTSHCRYLGLPALRSQRSSVSYSPFLAHSRCSVNLCGLNEQDLVHSRCLSLLNKSANEWTA